MSGGGRHTGSKRPTWKIDTYEKAMDIIDAMRLGRQKKGQPAYEQIRFITDIYPEMLECTHENIAEILGMCRETVTRVLANYSKRRKRWLTEK